MLIYDIIPIKLHILQYCFNCYGRKKPLYCLREHICKYYWQYSCFALVESMTINGMTSVLETGATLTKMLHTCCSHLLPNSRVLHSSDTYPHTSRCVLHLVHARPICAFLLTCCMHVLHMCNLHVCSTNSSTCSMHTAAIDFCKGS